MDIKGFTLMLEEISSNKMKEVPQNLTESINETEELYFVTEGWDEDDIDYLQENFSEEDMHTVLEESIFHGAGPHIISSIVNGGIKRGGEDSAVHVSTVTKKGHVYDHLRGADEGDGEKHDSKHTIVRHNGKVIASIHPQGEAGNIKYTANDQHDHAKDANGGQGTHISKGKAYDHIYNAIEKAGGYAGHHVELHSFKTDHARVGKEQSREALKHNVNPAHQSKSFQGIASRAANKVIDTHTGDDKLANHVEAHTNKIKNKLDTIRKHMKAAEQSKDYSSVVKHAGELHKLAETHPHADKEGAKSFEFKKRNVGATLQMHANSKGYAKDTGSLSPQKSATANTHIAKAIKNLKEGEKLKPTDGHQEDMFQSDKLKAQNAGGGYYEADKRRAQLDHARKSIAANHAAKGNAEKHAKDTEWKKTRAPDVHYRTRPGDKSDTDPQKAAAVISRANAWIGKK